MKYLKMILNDPTNLWYYLQGTVRMWLYCNAKWMLRPHIVEQFEWRKKRAKVCADKGSCVVCSCKCPDLFFADKACALSKIQNELLRITIAQRKTVCYPKMMSKSKWNINTKTKW